jgi:1,4-alpha-glucan branching enzyme
MLYTYMFTYPGKKLLFMGCDFAQGQEWNFDQALDWYVLDYPFHQGVKALVRDLNALYREQPALHCLDFESQGFEWIDCHDAGQSVLSYLRRDGERYAAVVLNFTPVVRESYRIGVPVGGLWGERLNSDSALYGGSNLGNAGGIEADAEPWMGRPYSLTLTLPPLAGVVLIGPG